MQLTQKETTILKDLKNQEQTCIEKYDRYSQDASDSQLKELFSSIGQAEKQHLDTINQILNGAVIAMNSQSQGKKPKPEFTPKYDTLSSDENKKTDSFLCTDSLSTEKHVSSVYDTGIFEFKDKNIRDALNHIQKEEQEHGERIYDYMSANGMYN